MNMIVTSTVEGINVTSEVRGEKGLRVYVLLNLCLFTCEEDLVGKPRQNWCLTQQKRRPFKCPRTSVQEESAGIDQPTPCILKITQEDLPICDTTIKGC